MNISEIQKILQHTKLDGWLLYDYKGSNSVAHRVLQIPSQTMITRRFFVWIPAVGETKSVVAELEKSALQFLPGQKISYTSWHSLHSVLRQALQEKKKIAMEYSPMGCLPALSVVDAGTKELIESFGPEVVSSSVLYTKLFSVLSDKEQELHREAANCLQEIVRGSFEKIGKDLLEGKTVTEYSVQKDLLEEFSKNNLVTDSGPICAVNQNSADPHFLPSRSHCQTIKKGDLVLIDLWGRLNCTGSIFADLCRVGLVGREPTPLERQIFSTVVHAQKAAIALIESSVKDQVPVLGWQVDQAARDVIEKNGYKDFFIHRLGHSIGQQDHGLGTHLDHYETKDERPLIANTVFSVEPGIYLPGQFGIRLETNVLLKKETVEITGGMQEKFILIK